MDLQSGGLSVEWFLKSRPLGKVRRRVREIRYASVLPLEVDLSHNESARLATDALLDGGPAAYQEVLTCEAEVNFLSREEKDYILKNAEDPSVVGKTTLDPDQVGVFSGSSVTYPLDILDSDPSGLDRRWPSPQWGDHLQGNPMVELFLQSNRTGVVRDLLRKSIDKATSVLAIVMDTFSDVEIFCDILAATRKRGVFAYILLDHGDLHLFVEMCEKLAITGAHLERMSIRSVDGGTYRAKSGRKFTGRVREKFVIIDRAQVIAGSFSFTWLSWQIHRGMAVLLKGSGVEAFDTEFRQLYATSQPVPGVPDKPRPSARPDSVSALWPSVCQPPFCTDYATVGLSYRPILHAFAGGRGRPTSQPYRGGELFYHTAPR